MPPSPGSQSAALFLVCGEDDFGVAQRARALFEHWCQEVGGMDHEVIDARVANAGEAMRALARLREALQTLPFFGTAKVIWFQGCSFLGDDRTARSSEVTAALALLAEELKRFRWDNVRLLLSAGKVDRRKTLAKTIEKLGKIEIFAPLSLEDKDWAAQAEAAAGKALRARAKTMSTEALAELVSLVGPNLAQLHSEIEKLALYTGARPAIEIADVQAVVTRTRQARAFALADAVGDRDLPRALACLENEFSSMSLDKDKSEIGLLYGLISKVRAMILAKELAREGWIKPESLGQYQRFVAQVEALPAERLPEDRRFNPRSLHPYVLYHASQQARRYSLDELVSAMERLLDCNRKLFATQLDEKLVLQQAIVHIVRGKNADGRSAPTGGRPTTAQMSTTGRTL